MGELKTMQCVPCRKGEPVLTEPEIEANRQQVPEWSVFEEQGEKRIRRVYKFKDFTGALSFTQRVGQLAESQDHHPSILTEWGKVTVTFWTHAIRGLHRNDFIMAAKTDELYASSDAKS